MEKTEKQKKLKNGKNKGGKRKSGNIIYKMSTGKKGYKKDKS